MVDLLIAHVLFYIVLVSDQVGHTERASARKGRKGREDSGLYSKKWVKKMRTEQGVALRMEEREKTALQRFAIRKSCDFGLYCFEG